MTTTTLEYHPENYLSASPAHGLPGTNFLYSSPLGSPEAFTLSLPVPRPRTRSLHAGYVWSSAILLADRLATGEVDVKGKRIVELGCGLALPGIVAAQMGAEQVCNVWDASGDYELTRRVSGRLDRLRQPDHACRHFTSCTTSAFSPATTTSASRRAHMGHKRWTGTRVRPEGDLFAASLRSCYASPEPALRPT